VYYFLALDTKPDLSYHKSMSKEHINFITTHQIEGCAPTEIGLQEFTACKKISPNQIHWIIEPKNMKNRVAWEMTGSVYAQIQNFIETHWVEEWQDHGTIAQLRQQLAKTANIQDMQERAAWAPIVTGTMVQVGEMLDLSVAVGFNGAHRSEHMTAFANHRGLSLVCSNTHKILYHTKSPETFAARLSALIGIKKTISETINKFLPPSDAPTPLTIETWGKKSWMVGFIRKDSSTATSYFPSYLIKKVPGEWEASYYKHSKAVEQKKDREPFVTCSFKNLVQAIKTTLPLHLKEVHKIKYVHDNPEFSRSI
jgi:hypothetical protein